MLEKREINPVINDTDKPLFYIGKFRGNDSIAFNIAASFKGVTETTGKQFGVDIVTDTSQSAKIIPTMLAFEHLQDMLATDFDTTAVVELAMQYNLLCDYTALIALEPDEEHRPMDDPDDESDFSAVLKADTETDSKSIFSPILLTSTLLLTSICQNRLALVFRSIISADSESIN